MNSAGSSGDMQLDPAPWCTDDRCAGYSEARGGQTYADQTGRHTRQVSCNMLHILKYCFSCAEIFIWLANRREDIMVGRGESGHPTSVYLNGSLNEDLTVTNPPSETSKTQHSAWVCYRGKSSNWS